MEFYFLTSLNYFFLFFFLSFFHYCLIEYLLIRKCLAGEIPDKKHIRGSVERTEMYCTPS